MSTRRTPDPQVLLVAASTGGPRALEEFFTALPKDFPLPVVVVQHIPPHFVESFAAQLDKRTGFRVRVAAGGETPAAGEIWFGPGEHHITLERQAPLGHVPYKLALCSDPPEHGCRPAADVLFRSAAKALGARALACVLTGMGKDGLDGARQIHAAGGRVFAQDEASSVVWSMPGGVHQAGLATATLPPAELARAIAMVPGGASAPIARPAAEDKHRTEAELDGELFDYLRDLVRRQSGIVMSETKSYLVQANLKGIASEEGKPSVAQLLSDLRDAPFAALEARVAEAMTIKETSFFRDRPLFDALETELLPGILRAREVERSLSIWSAACSSGQEIYSLLILLRERFPELGSWKVNVLASDISRRDLERAEQGLFSAYEASRGLDRDVLERHFLPQGTRWKVRPEVRRLVEFQRINLMEQWDLPTYDLILLRNVLYYFDDGTRERILARVRDQLNPGGALVLGSMETRELCVEGLERDAVGGVRFYRRCA